MILLLPVLSLFFLLPVVGIVLGIMTAVDVAKYPDWAFGQTGASKTVWQILPIVLGFFCLGIGGIVMYTMWVSSKRQAVAQVAQTGAPPYGYGYGAPPPGWGGPPPAPTWTPPPGSPPPPSGPTGPPPSQPYPPAPDPLPPPPAVEPPQ